jgi:hypothetical protein
MMNLMPLSPGPMNDGLFCLSLTFFACAGQFSNLLHAFVCYFSDYVNTYFIFLDNVQDRQNNFSV